MTEPVYAGLVVDARTLKSLREALCAAQWALGASAGRGVDVDATPYRVAALQRVIDQVDRHRPIRCDGKHADLHTSTCGCEDVPARPDPTVQYAVLDELAVDEPCDECDHARADHPDVGACTVPGCWCREWWAKS